MSVSLGYESTVADAILLLRNLRNRSENKTLAKQAKDKNQPRHALFQKRAKMMKDREKEKRAAADQS